VCGGEREIDASGELLANHGAPVAGKVEATVTALPTPRTRGDRREHVGIAGLLHLRIGAGTVAESSER
jgi:hypothetical protein